MKTFQEVFFENFEQLFKPEDFFTPVLIKKYDIHNIEHHLLHIQYNQFFTALIIDIQFELSFSRMIVELHEPTLSGSMYSPFKSFSFAYTDGEKYENCFNEISYFFDECKRNLSFDL